MASAELRHLLRLKQLSITDEARRGEATLLPQGNQRRHLLLRHETRLLEKQHLGRNPDTLRRLLSP
jgi:hypothetical protein